MKILLSSVFGPYGVDDKYGRKENVMELFHNQVTREQGIFSLRFHHQSFGLYFIAENICASTVILDFPSEKRFIQEIKKGYDYIGISFIVPNFIKAKQMGKLIRKYAPKSKIILGGHGTRIDKIEKKIEHDYICRGEGVRWFRNFLGEDVNLPLKHPILSAAFSKKILGVPLKSEAAVLIPGVGCVNGCRFCATSHFFHKTYTPFLNSGKEIFDVCIEIEQKTGYKEFFVMDENFLKCSERAKELVKLMEEHNKFYRFGIFSSAETIANVGIEFLARLGVSFLWIGVESKHEIYEKNKGLDIKTMLSKLKNYGVSVLASGILFLEHHNKRTIWDDIKYITSLKTDCVQFMQLGPMPGTPLYDNYNKKGLLRKNLPYEEWHGQHQIWFNHPHFTPEESSKYLKDAFLYDYHTQGPSIMRMFETLILGHKTLSQSKDPYLLKRSNELKAWAKKYRLIMDSVKLYAPNKHVKVLADEVMELYKKVIGPMSVTQKILSKLVNILAIREHARVIAGANVYQPKPLKTKLRICVKDLFSQQLKGKSLTNLLYLDVNWKQPNSILIKMNGIMDKINMKILRQKIKSYLKHENGELILNLEGLESIEDMALKKLLKKIKGYHSRIKLVYKDGGEAIHEVISSLPHDLSKFFKVFMKEKLKGKNLSNFLNLNIKWGIDSTVFVELEGIMDKVNVKKLKNKLKEYFSRKDRKVLLSIDGIQAIEDDALKTFFKKIKHYQGQVRIICEKSADATQGAIQNLSNELSVFFEQNRQILTK